MFAPSPWEPVRTTEALSCRRWCKTRPAGWEGGPLAAPNLAQFLPPGDVNVVWNSRDLQRLVDFYMRLYGPMLDEQPQLRTVSSLLVEPELVADLKGSAMA